MSKSNLESSELMDDSSDASSTSSGYSSSNEEESTDQLFESNNLQENENEKETQKENLNNAKELVNEKNENEHEHANQKNVNEHEAAPNSDSENESDSSSDSSSDSETDSESGSGSESDTNQKAKPTTTSNRSPQPCVTPTPSTPIQKNKIDDAWTPPNPEDDPIPPELRAGNRMIAAGHSLKGVCRRNEDCFVSLLSMPGDPSSAFFAVFDGHGGTKGSAFCTRYLNENIVREASYKVDMRTAVVNGFMKTDKLFLSQEEGCGSTAVMAIITYDSRLLVANAGDCRCIAYIDGEVVALSEDHKPGHPTERSRIEAAKHSVTTSRVVVKGRETKVDRIDGIISVSRAIGDPDFKNYDGGGPEAQAITCIPDIVEHTVTHKYKFLVLACDGLWDVMTNRDVVDFVNQRLKGLKQTQVTEEALQIIAEELCTYAVDIKQSTDNVTAVIVYFTGFNN